jgi:hypothetical protein
MHASVFKSGRPSESVVAESIDLDWIVDRSFSEHRKLSGDPTLSISWELIFLTQRFVLPLIHFQKPPSSEFIALKFESLGFTTDPGMRKTCR